MVLSRLFQNTPGGQSFEVENLIEKGEVDFLVFEAENVKEAHSEYLLKNLTFSKKD